MMKDIHTNRYLRARRQRFCFKYPGYKTESQENIESDKHNG